MLKKGELKGGRKKKKGKTLLLNEFHKMVNLEKYKPKIDNLTDEYIKIFKRVCKIRKKELNKEMDARIKVQNILELNNDQKNENQIDKEYEAFEDLVRYKNNIALSNMTRYLYEDLLAIEKEAKLLSKQMRKDGFSENDTNYKEILLSLHLTEGFQKFIEDDDTKCGEILVNKHGHSSYKKLKNHISLYKKRGKVIKERNKKKENKKKKSKIKKESFAPFHYNEKNLWEDPP
jgi:hypothetical protein